MFCRFSFSTTWSPRNRAPNLFVQTFAFQFFKGQDFLCDSGEEAYKPNSATCSSVS